MWQEIESDFPALYSLYIFPYILLYSLNGGASWLIVSSSTKLLYYITKCYLFKIAMHGKIGKLIGVKLMILCLDITRKNLLWQNSTILAKVSAGSTSSVRLLGCLIVCLFVKRCKQSTSNTLVSLLAIKWNCIVSQPLLAICHPVDLVLGRCSAFQQFYKNFTWLF